MGTVRPKYLLWVHGACGAKARHRPKSLPATGGCFPVPEPNTGALILLMDKILHDPKDPKLWELWYIPYNG